jgi:hypothetical protein
VRSSHCVTAAALIAGALGLAACGDSGQAQERQRAERTNTAADTRPARPTRFLDRAPLDAITVLGQTDGNPAKVCQVREHVPQGAGAIQLGLQAVNGPGPRLTLTASRRGELVTRGARSAGWRAKLVEIPVRKVTRTATGTRICVRVSSGGQVALWGGIFNFTSPASTGSLDGQTLTGILWIRYLKPRTES